MPKSDEKAEAKMAKAKPKARPEVKAEAKAAPKPAKAGKVIATGPTEEMVTLVGKAHRMQIFNLMHETYCEALGRCECHLTDVHSAVTSRFGVTSMVSRKARHPKVLTIMHLQRVVVPKAVLAEPTVAAAVKARDLLRVQG